MLAPVDADAFQPLPDGLHGRTSNPVFARPILASHQLWLMQNAASYGSTWIYMDLHGSTWIYMICVGLRSIVKLEQRAVKRVKLTIVAITFPMFPHYSDGSRGPVLILHRNVIQLKNCSTFEGCLRLGRQK